MPLNGIRTSITGKGVNMWKRIVRAGLLACVALGFAACSDSSDNANTDTLTYSYEEMGPYPVGNRTITVMNASEGRTLDVEIWYPAASAQGTQSIADFAIDEAERDELTALLDSAPEQCTRRETSSSRDAAPISSPARLPLVIFSHCFECTRYSSFSLAERLASHGIAVAAPDHARNTLFDTGAMLSVEFLATRASDVSAVLDELLTENSQALPESLQGRFDAERVAIAGHSYGAVTAGKILQDDPRFKAGLIIAAPVESPVFPGVAVANIEEPLLFMVAAEDNSIGTLGNIFIGTNFDAAAAPAWKVEIADAGHWSFSDIAGLVPAFNAGCGGGVRQTVPGDPFTYLDNALARDITATYGMLFFASQLLDDPAALEALQTSILPDIVDVQVK
jgi:predicted dienelactone hydrolase